VIKDFGKFQMNEKQQQQHFIHEFRYQLTLFLLLHYVRKNNNNSTENISINAVVCTTGSISTTTLQSSSNVPLSPSF